MLFPDVFTDRTTAELFAFLFGQNVRYDHQRGIWLLWSGHYWQADATQAIIPAVFSLSDIIRKEGESLQQAKDTHTRGKYLCEQALKLQSKTKITNLMALAKACRPIAVTGDEFDTKPMLLGVQNGIIDLTTGQLREGKPTDYLSMIAPVTYDPDATCPKWEAFIDTIFSQDDHLIDWMRRVLGYSISGDMREQLVFIFYGNGGNGKSRLLDVLQGLLGSYMAKAPKDFFSIQTFYHQINDASFMRRKRVIFTSENVTNTALNIELLKSISSPDIQRGRELFHEAVDFMPLCKMFISTNHLPHFDDDSYGFDRRIKVVPFIHQFSGDEEIKDYHKILLQEAPGILNWLIESCLMWQEKGLTDIPAAVTAATMGYKRENNPLTEYIEERTYHDEEEKIQSSLLFSDYLHWTSIQRKTPITQTMFSLKMKQLGYELKKERDANYFLYLRLKIL